MWSLEKLKSSAHSAQGAHCTMPEGQRVVEKVQKMHPARVIMCEDEDFDDDDELTNVMVEQGFLTSTPKCLLFH